MNRNPQSKHDELLHNTGVINVSDKYSACLCCYHCRLHPLPVRGPARILFVHGGRENLILFLMLWNRNRKRRNRKLFALAEPERIMVPVTDLHKKEKK
jgi:hypothetical protein